MRIKYVRIKYGMSQGEWWWYEEKRVRGALEIRDKVCFCY